MLPLSTLLAHSLLYGALFSALMTALILGTLAWRPMIWIGDAPADVQAAVGPMSAADRRARRLAGVVMLVIVGGVFAAALARLAALSGGALTFADAAVSTFLIYMTFNVVDLLLIDWLLLLAIRPRFMFFPGTENLAGNQDYAYHFRAFLKGTLLGVALSLLIAAVAVLVW